MILIAHRGFSKRHLENSISALKAAVVHGFYGVEFDVRASADKKIFLMHDSNLRRTTRHLGKISKKSSEYLHNGILKNNEKIPTLEDAFHVVKNFKLIVIEVKDEGFEKELLQQIRKHKLTSKVIVASFHQKVLESLRELDKKIRLCLETRIISIKHIHIAKRINAGYITGNAYLLRKNKLLLARRHELEVFPYMVNSKIIKRKMEKLNVDGMFVDG